MGAELRKMAEELSSEAREHIAKKNFALTSKQSETGKPAYPIHDAQHARTAIGMVGMHGTPQQKAEVYKDIVRKYPELAAKSKAIQAWEEKKASEIGIPPMGSDVLRRIAQHLHTHEDAYELGGLGLLGAIGLDRLQAHARAGRGAHEHDIEKRQLMGESGHAGLDTLGLGVLAAPIVAKKYLGHLRCRFYGT